MGDRTGWGWDGVGIGRVGDRTGWGMGRGGGTEPSVSCHRNIGGASSPWPPFPTCSAQSASLLRRC